MSWYYVDKEGQTQGGFEVSVLKQKYSAKQLDEESYVWNGTSVNQWTPLKQVNELMSQLKTAAAPSRPSSRPARRKSPFGGGGGRANFLASIQKGANLKKVEPKKESDKPAPKSGGGGGGGGGMDLMSQLRAKQNAMKKKGTIGGAKKAGGGAKTGGPAKSGPRPSGGPKKTWGKPSTTSTTSPKKTWGKPTSSPSKSYGGSSGGGGTSSARITKIKNKLDSAQEWQLKAIEKILS